MSFTEQDYKNAAAKLGVEVAAVKAVADVESSGTTHWADGRPPILFEALWFHKLTGGKYDSTHPGISSPVWDQSLYIGGPREYGRLNEAIALDRAAALQSASWGGFQVMGFNWKNLGYGSLDEFYDAMQNDAGQLDSFIRYIKVNHLTNALIQHDWDAFAAGYNGTGAVAVYAPKIEEAYEHYAGGGGPRALRQGDRGDDVMALQKTLGIPADGDFGPKTAAAVRLFQGSHGLQVDGIAGVATRTALHLM
jgi:hypothetical protein